MQAKTQYRVLFFRFKNIGKVKEVWDGGGRKLRDIGSTENFLSIDCIWDVEWWAMRGSNSRP
jgi:hypothetical protein